MCSSIYREVGETCSKHERIMRENNLRAAHGYRTRRIPVGKLPVPIPNLLELESHSDLTRWLSCKKHLFRPRYVSCCLVPGYLLATFRVWVLASHFRMHDSRSDT